MLYDLQVSRGGSLVTDLTTSSLRRVTDRAIEVEDRGELYRVVDRQGNILGPEYFKHDYRTKGRIRRKIRSR